MSAESAQHRVKIRRIENGEALRGGRMEGWTDLDTPLPGWPFRVWGPPLEQDHGFRLLQTSPVKSFTAVPRMDEKRLYLIKTMNSIYEVEYVAEGGSQADGHVLGSRLTEWAVPSER